MAFFSRVDDDDLDLLDKTIRAREHGQHNPVVVVVVKQVGGGENEWL